MSRYVRSRILPALAVVGALLVSVTPNAGAYQTWSDRRMLSGVWGNLYWVDAAAQSMYPVAIADGTGKWNATGRVAFNRTSVKADSHLDFYYDASEPAYCAVTKLYVNTTDVGSPPTQSWWWARVYLTHHLTKSWECGTIPHRSAIAAHEQGHAMGLAHAVLADRLMYAGIAGTNVEKPMSDDINGIIHLYW